MAHYLYQVAYTPQAWAELVSSRQNRLEAVRPVVENLGGKIESYWMAFGDYDIVVVCEMPDNVSAAAFSVAANAGGALKAIKTTPLMSIEEGLRVLGKAAEAGYRPPGA